MSGPLADHPWRVIPEETRPGAMQMALEEAAAETVAEGGPATLRLYGWESSTLSLGYRTKPETVDWVYCDSNGIDVTRRQTGGGAIFHDGTGDIAYSIVAPKDALPNDLLECYDMLCQPILTGLQSLGLNVCFASEELASLYYPACYLRDVDPAHDVMVTVDGIERKVSGNAQYRQRDAVIQHGSITYRANPTDHLGVFADPDITESEFSDRVTAITEHVDAERGEATAVLEESLIRWAQAEQGSWRDTEGERARELVEEKYGASSWIEDRTVCRAD